MKEPTAPAQVQTAGEAPARGRKVLVVTPNSADAGLTQSFLRDAGMEALTRANLRDAASELAGDIGCIVLVEESLIEPDIYTFQNALGRQPPWSDIPLLLIAGQDTPLATLTERVFTRSGNITLLQRPLHPVALVSAVSVALRARAHQFEVRDLLEQRADAVRRRDEFLAMLAHELRNPLTPVRNAVYLLNTLDIGDATFLKARELIGNQVQHMAHLVDDLLDVSRLEVGKVELRQKSLDLNAVIAAAAEACLPMTSARKHHVDIHLAPAPLYVFADPVRVEQIISNLIGNAAKFTPPGGLITLEARQEDMNAVLIVQDNGIGIRHDMQKAVFDLFRQDDSSLARSAGGLGIGLTVVRRLMELHGGSIEVHSEGLGSGARFTARFPLVAWKEDAVAAPPPAPERGTRKRVLIVEDNADIRESLRMLIAMWQHDVAFAETGNDGVRKAREFQPDIALVDIGLPGLDGYGVARQIRDTHDEWSRNVQLVALTGYGQPSDRDKALQAGFDTHLLKPLDPAVLEELLSAAKPLRENAA